MGIGTFTASRKGGPGKGECCTRSHGTLDMADWARGGHLAEPIPSGLLS